MRVDREVDLLDRELILARDDQLVDDLGRVRANDVRAEDFTVLRVADDLHEPVRVARGARAPVGRERELADLVVELALLGLRFREADRGDLGVTVGAVRYIRVVHRMRMLPRDQLREHMPLARTLVGEHLVARHIADRVDVGRTRPELVVDLDEPTLRELHAGFPEPGRVGVRRPTGCDEHLLDGHVALLPARFDSERDGILTDFDVRHLGAGEDFNSALPERLRHFGGAVGVFEREDLRRDLDDGDFSAVGVEHVAELAADRARADDEHRLRRLVQHEHVIAREYGRFVQFEPNLRQSAHARARRDDDGLMRVVRLGLAVGSLDDDLLSLTEFGFALEVGDLVLLEEELDALGVLLAHGARALHRGAEVERNFAERDAVFAGLL